MAVSKKMITDTLLVSIIIPCYNQGHFLEDALKSVLMQSYKVWECIVVDDGSQDSTKEIAEKWQNQDSRFKYTYKENGGLSSARNHGLELSKGDYIQFLDADDTISPDKIVRSISVLDDSNQAGIAISNYQTLMGDIDKIKPPYYTLDGSFFTFEKILYEWDETFAIPIHCGFFKAQLFENFRFPTSLKAKEDWMMWLSFFKQGSEAVYIDEYLAFYRKHEKSMTEATDIFPEILKAIHHVKTIISPEEAKLLDDVLLKRYYKKAAIYREELSKVKASFSYRLAKKAVRFLKKVKLIS